MSVNEARAEAFVKMAMTAAAGSSDACCGQNCAAFRILQAMRQQPGASLDTDLAAAEHYTFAKCFVCTGAVGRTQMRALVVGYDLKKTLDSITGDPNAAAVTGNPVSPPDLDVVAWGLAGVSDGADDHDSCNAGASAPWWRPVDEILGKKPAGSGY